MPDQTAFETRLTDAYARYVALAPIAVDPRAVAAAAATRGARRASGWHPSFVPGRRAVLLIAAGLLVLSFALGATFVGSQVAPRPAVLPPAVPTAAPTATPGDTSGYRGVFTSQPDMTISRIDPVVVTLADGLVLIAAGEDATPATPEVPAEVFDPVTGQSTTIALGAPAGKGGGSGVLLPDGRVFIIVHDGNHTSSRAYLVDPRSMSSHPIPQKGYSNAPVFGVNPTMALLHDGRVLVAGGLADVYKSTILDTAQLFDPVTETFTPTGHMAVPRWRHSMTTLTDGRVLVAGGEGRADDSQPSGDPIPPYYRSDAEIYDPKTGKFIPTGAMSQVRGQTVAVPLPDGRVVVLPRWGTFSGTPVEVSGAPTRYDPSSPVPVEIYDPTTGTFAPGGTTSGIATSATLLRSGRILLTGTAWTPSSGEAVGTWSAIYDPESGSVETKKSPRAWSGAPTTLADGRILFAGGGDGGGDPASTGWPLEPVPWVQIFE